MLDKGEVKEEGSHQELLDDHKDGLYAKFVKIQQKAEEQASEAGIGQADTSPEKKVEIPKDNGDFKGEELSIEEKMKKTQADMQDKEAEDRFEELKAKLAKRSWTSKLSVYNRPAYLIIVGLLASMVCGAAQPCLGLVMSKYLVYVSVPIPQLKLIVAPDFDGTNLELLSSRVSLIALILTGMAILCGVGKLLQFVTFQLLGGKVTFSIRIDTYNAILEKNLGWFDLREHSTGILTTALAEDASIINGAGAGSFPTEAEACLSLGTGLVISFIYSW